MSCRSGSLRTKRIAFGALCLLAVVGSVALLSYGTKTKSFALVSIDATAAEKRKITSVGDTAITLQDTILSVEKPEMKTVAKSTTLALTADEEADLLDQHNALRCMHEEPAMAWDATLASQAQAWADQIKADSPDKCQGAHSDRASSFRNGAVSSTPGLSAFDCPNPCHLPIQCSRHPLA